MPSERPTHDEVKKSTTVTEARMRPQTIPVNAYETPAAFVVVAPMPAVTADDVQIELRPGSVRLWAQLRSAGPREYLIHEWEYGGYEREIELPDGFGSSVEASLANGQLAIRVLRGEATEERRIKPTSL